MSDSELPKFLTDLDHGLQLHSGWRAVVVNGTEFSETPVVVVPRNPRQRSNAFCSDEFEVTAQTNHLALKIVSDETWDVIQERAYKHLSPIYLVTTGTLAELADREEVARAPLCIAPLDQPPR